MTLLPVWAEQVKNLVGSDANLLSLLSWRNESLHSMDFHMRVHALNSVFFEKVKV